MLTFAEMKESFRQDGHDFTLEQYQMIARIDDLFAYKVGRRMDANESFALLRKLTQFLDEIYDVKLEAELMFNQVAPMRLGRINPGAKKFGWYVREKIGELKFLGNGAEDLPKLNWDLKEKEVDIQIAGAKIIWTWQDIAAAIFQGISLPTDGAMVARTAADHLHERVTLKGDTQFGVGGMLSKPSDLTAYNSGTTINWAGLADIDAKVTAIQAVARTVSTATSRRFKASMILLPSSYYDELEDAKYGDSNNYSTALDYLEWVYRRRNLKILSWEKLTGVTTTGISNKDVMMAYPFSFECLENAIVDPFFMKAPKEDDNYNVFAGVYTKTAGIVWRQPKSGVWAKLN